MTISRFCSGCGRHRDPAHFRAGQRVCSACQWKDPRKRAQYRYRDITKGERSGLRKAVLIGESQFVDWYVSREDCCEYCAVTRDELTALGSTQVSWAIDRKDNLRGYEEGNLALACNACNTAKGATFTYEEAKLIGLAIAQIYQRRLRAGSLDF